jgi:hypothetical protein
VYRVIVDVLEHEAKIETSRSAPRDTNDARRRRANLLAWAVMFRHTTLFTKPEWLELLSASPRLLVGVPHKIKRSGLRYIAGEDVGVALEAAARGMSCQKLHRRRPRAPVKRVPWQVEASIRLDFELGRILSATKRGPGAS